MFNIVPLNLYMRQCGRRNLFYELLSYRKANAITMLLISLFVVYCFNHL